MATSSIFANVKITDPEKAEAFINALDAAANAPRISRKPSNMRYVTDHDEIRRMFEKRKELHLKKTNESFKKTES